MADLLRTLRGLQCSFGITALEEQKGRQTKLCPQQGRLSRCRSFERLLCPVELAAAHIMLADLELRHSLLEWIVEPGERLRIARLRIAVSTFGGEHGRAGQHYLRILRLCQLRLRIGLARAGNTTQTQICSCKGYEAFGDAWLASRRPLRGLENVPWRWSGQVELLLTQLPLRQCRPPVRVRWSNLEDRANGTLLRRRLTFRLCRSQSNPQGSTNHSTSQ